MNKNRFPAFGILCALLLAFTACDDPFGSDEGARVTVLLTDAPGDFATADVEIREIYLQGNADGDESDGRVVLFSGREVFDLLGLQTGVTAELADVSVPAGTYPQLRLVIGEATITTEGGTTYSTEDNTLQCPSCSSS